MLFDSGSRQGWPEDAGFFPEDMSPVVTFENADAAALQSVTHAPAMRLGSSQGASQDSSRDFFQGCSKASTSSAVLGPQGPIPPWPSADDESSSLFRLLQSSSVNNTPRGTPKGTPKGTPMVTPGPSPVASPLWTSRESAKSPSPIRLSHSRSGGAAFLPPEFFLDSAISTSASSGETSATKRSKSPLTEHQKVLEKCNFSLPLQPRPHVECIVTESAVEALCLVEEEITRMMDAVQI